MNPAPALPTRRELLHAKLDALLDESDLVADSAAYGETFDDMENFFLIKGRKFLQETFQEQLQQCVEHTETTAEAKTCPHCKKKRATKTKNQNT
jgi:hypothetical protein